MFASGRRAPLFSNERITEPPLFSYVSCLTIMQNLGCGLNHALMTSYLTEFDARSQHGSYMRMLRCLRGCRLRLNEQGCPSHLPWMNSGVQSPADPWEESPLLHNPDDPRLDRRLLKFFHSRLLLADRATSTCKAGRFVHQRAGGFILLGISIARVRTVMVVVASRDTFLKAR